MESKTNRQACARFDYGESTVNFDKQVKDKERAIYASHDN